jgi:hypothetical protein
VPECKPRGRCLFHAAVRMDEGGPTLLHEPHLENEDRVSLFLLLLFPFLLTLFSLVFFLLALLFYLF